MKEIRLRKPAGLDQLETRNMESGPVTRGEIRVRLHASSLNVHDSFVLKGVIPTEAGRIPLSVRWGRRSDRDRRGGHRVLAR